MSGQTIYFLFFTFILGKIFFSLVSVFLTANVSVYSQKIADTSENPPKTLETTFINTDLYNKGKSFALDYIKSKKDDELWSGKNPTLAPYAFVYYSDDEVTPAYLEYKIICDKSDCGFVMVNIDGNDVLIPEASVFGKTNSELLIGKNRIKSQKSLKLHRFGLFEQYLSNDTEIVAIDPLDKTTTHEELVDKKIKFKSFKSTDEFKNFKKSLQNGSSDNFDGTVEATNGSNTPIVVGATTNVYVPGSSNFACPSRTPCYNQFNTSYNGMNCANGCSPIAAAIIMGYHDINSKPNLIAGSVASTTNNSIVNGMALSIAGSMQTFCTNNQQGSTYISNIANGIQYAKNNGYPSSYSSYSTNTIISPLLSAIQSEINAGRPAIVTTNNHALVVYGYSNTVGSTAIRVNYGWGADYANRDVTMTNVPVNGVNMSINGISKYVIQ